MCRGRDRFTITFQLIKNQHTPDCIGLSITRLAGVCARPYASSLAAHLTTLLVNVICLRTFRGITQDTGSQVARVVATAGRTYTRAFRTTPVAVLTREAALRGERTNSQLGYLPT